MAANSTPCRTAWVRPSQHFLELSAAAGCTDVLQPVAHPRWDLPEALLQLYTPAIDAILQQYQESALRWPGRSSMGVHERDQPRSVNTIAKYRLALRCLVGFAAAENKLESWDACRPALAGGRCCR